MSFWRTFRGELYELGGGVCELISFFPYMILTLLFSIGIIDNFTY